MVDVTTCKEHSRKSLAQIFGPKKTTQKKKITWEESDDSSMEEYAWESPLGYKLSLNRKVCF